MRMQKGKYKGIMLLMEIHLTVTIYNLNFSHSLFEYFAIIYESSDLIFSIWISKRGYYFKTRNLKEKCV